jgi:hypothetical protein
MADISEAIRAFWRVFQDHQAEFVTISTADHPVYDLILAQLQQVNPGLFFEFSTQPQKAELIITADGKRSLFPLVERVVRDAPDIPGWSILALKPKLWFPVTASWEHVTIRIADVVFDPLQDPDSIDLGLRLFVPDLRPEDTQDAHNAILRALDHGLGEKDFADSVTYTEVRPLPDGASPEDHIPLVQLENYIAWRKRELKEDAGPTTTSGD